MEAVAVTPPTGWNRLAPKTSCGTRERTPTCRGRTNLISDERETESSGVGNWAKALNRCAVAELAAAHRVRRGHVRAAAGGKIIIETLARGPPAEARRYARSGWCTTIPLICCTAGSGHNRSCASPPRQRRAQLTTIAPLLPRLLEIAQIRRGLILVGRHQLAIGGVNNVSLIADLDPNVVLRAGLQQPHRARILLADGLLDFGVGPRHGVIYHGDLVIERVAVGLVEIEPLLDVGLVVLVKGNAGNFISAWTPQVSGLDF